MSSKRSVADAEETADKIARAIRLATATFGQLSLPKIEGDKLCDAELFGDRVRDRKGGSPRPS